MNQIEKTEVIIGLIAIIKSRIVAKVFSENEKTNPNDIFIKDNTEKIKKLEDILKHFYEKPEIPDKEYEMVLKEIRAYE